MTNTQRSVIYIIKILHIVKEVFSTGNTKKKIVTEFEHLENT